MIFVDCVYSHIRYLNRLKNVFTDRINRLPEGKVFKKHYYGKIYYYEVLGERRKSLQKDTERRDLLLEREMLEKQLTDIEMDLKLLSQVADKYRPVLPNISTQNGDLNVYAQSWQTLQPEQNPYRAEDKKHPYKGVYYRSKSELAIAMMLTAFGFEFKYETAVEINGRNIYPDFAVRRPRDGKVIFWEHFGLIGFDEYRDSMYRKLLEYHEAGYNIWDNLIVSFDKEDGSVSGDYMEKIIKLYLL